MGKKNGNQTTNQTRFPEEIWSTSAKTRFEDVDNASSWLRQDEPSPAQVIDRPCQDGDVVQAHHKSRQNGS